MSTERAAVMPMAFADLVALTKPRITFMVVLTTSGGMWLAGHPSASRVLCTLIGTALVVAGANTLNMYLERDIDGRMARTRDRPLPAGRLRPEVALALGIALAVLSVPILAVLVNPLTAALGTLSLALYVLAYTPLKQRSSAALLVGAVPGAMPPLMGWTATTGSLETGGLLLFAVMFIWQLPHFTAITLYRTDDYARAGFKILAAERPIGRGARVAKWWIVATLACLVPVSLALVPAGVAGREYGACAALLGGGLLAQGIVGLRADAKERWARGLFVGSLIYLTALFAILIIGRGR